MAPRTPLILTFAAPCARKDNRRDQVTLEDFRQPWVAGSGATKTSTKITEVGRETTDDN